MINIVNCIYTTPPEGAYIVVYASAIGQAPILGLGQVVESLKTKILLWDETLFPTRSHFPIGYLTMNDVGNNLYKLFSNPQNESVQPIYNIGEL